MTSMQAAIADLPRDTLELKAENVVCANASAASPVRGRGLAVIRRRMPPMRVQHPPWMPSARLLGRGRSLGSATVRLRHRRVAHR